MREWEIVGQVYITRGNKTRRFRIGDVCRLRGSESLWRIVGIEINRYDGSSRVRLRGHVVTSLAITEEAHRLAYVKPPYPV